MSESDPGKIINGMPTNPRFDFWHLFLEEFMKWQKTTTGVPVNFQTPFTNEVFKPLYYANGRNGYPQIVIGNPITILTWVDTNACVEGCEGNPACIQACGKLPYGGAKVLYLREINAAVDHYERPVKWPSYPPEVLARIGPNDPAYRNDPLVGKVVLKNGYVIYDHTGDMFPDLWWPEDVQAMREMLIRVLRAEGEQNPNPILFMAAHFFSDTHVIKPAEQALGAKSCNDCHGHVEKGEPGAHRVTDRIVAFLPWAPEWFKEEYRLLKWDRENGLQVNNPNGFFVVDPEVYYIKPIEANGLRFLGAREEEILEHSLHHAKELFYLKSYPARGAEIEDLVAFLSPEERQQEFEKQLVNGPWDDPMFFYIPTGFELEACGITPTKEKVYLADKKGYDPRGRVFEAYVVRVEFKEEAPEAYYIRIPFEGSKPVIWTREGEAGAFHRDSSAEILEYSGAYVLVRVTHAGEFVAVDPNVSGSFPLF